jgi:hypothetical protein
LRSLPGFGLFERSRQELLNQWIALMRTNDKVPTRWKGITTRMLVKAGCYEWKLGFKAIRHPWEQFDEVRFRDPSRSSTDPQFLRPGASDGDSSNPPGGHPPSRDDDDEQRSTSYTTGGTKASSGKFQYKS